MNNLQNLPHSLHFVGVGGIGMSGLAQMAHTLGCEVSGSDRALNNPENAGIIHALDAGGIRLFPQDGSCYQTIQPDALVYSTAIEEDNPDFKNALPGTPRIHRSQALSLCVNAMKGTQVVAVAGTCGKTTVSAWLAEAMANCGMDPSFLSGGLLNRFRSPALAGNFRKGTGNCCVIEADESDKSLLNYPSDASLVLNIGTDHYSKEELAEVFRKFILHTAKFSVVELEAFRTIGADSLENADITLFSLDFNAPETCAGRRVFKLDSYRVTPEGVFTSFAGLRSIRLPSPGLHNAANALAVYVMLTRLGCQDSGQALQAIEHFSGVWRRFDFAGNHFTGARVYDDYAHNVEKLVSCLKAAQEICADGRVLAFFQPHGFGPLKFMRQELLHALEQTLRPNDVFTLMPVYYAGGTTTFSPTSQEVRADYAEKAKNPAQYQTFSDRTAAEAWIDGNTAGKDLVLIMGARDNSLSFWAKKIAEKPENRQKS